jgi:hypothetical protein
MDMMCSGMVSNNGKTEEVRGIPAPVAFVLTRISLEMNCIVFRGR